MRITKTVKNLSKRTILWKSYRRAYTSTRPGCWASHALQHVQFTETQVLPSRHLFSVRISHQLILQKFPNVFSAQGVLLVSAGKRSPSVHITSQVLRPLINKDVLYAFKVYCNSLYFRVLFSFLSFNCCYFLFFSRTILYTIASEKYDAFCFIISLQGLDMEFQKRGAIWKEDWRKANLFSSLWYVWWYGLTEIELMLLFPVCKMEETNREQTRSRSNLMNSALCLRWFWWYL